MSFLKKIEFHGRRIILRFLTTFISPPKASFPEKIRSAVIVRIDERLGNVVLLNSVMASFLRNNIRTTLVVCRRFGQIYQYDKRIRIIYFEKKKLFNPIHLVRFILELRQKDHDLLFDASNPNDLSTLTLFVILLVRARIKYGFDRKNSRMILNKTVPRPSKPMHILAYYELLFKKLNLEFHQERILKIPSRIASACPVQKEKGKRIIIAHPGGRGLKQWDVVKMLRFLSRIDQRRFKIVLILGPDEKHLVPVLKKKDYIYFVPQDVMELLSLLSAGDFYIGNDSGPMHLASGLGLSVLAIFKPDASVVFHPVAKHYRIIKTDSPFQVNPEEMYKKFKDLVRISS